MHGDKIIIATLDGRLIALDKATGRPIWTTQTFDHAMPYSITGAPRVFGDKVVVGQSGGDLGVRGFVSAYDVETGAKLWKFFLTPGDPAKGPDGEASDPIMDRIRATWSEDGPVEAARRRGQPVGFDRLRSRARPGLRRHRQRLAAFALLPFEQRRATTCSSARSSRSMPRTAATPGTTRWSPARSGTGPAPARSSPPT
jgi:hypothetical protein